MTRRLLAFSFVLGLGGHAHAANVLVTTPRWDPAGGRLSVLAGALSDEGRSVKNVSLELMADGAPLGAPLVVESLGDQATRALETSNTWKPPVAVGIVYLYVKDIPEGIRMLDGIYAFVRRIPGRTTIYPTPYGRMRLSRAPLVPADIGRLEEVQYLEGYRPNLVGAMRTNLEDLRGDTSPLRLMLVVTDGRDFNDTDGEKAGDFLALGNDLAAAGVKLQMVSFTPTADVEQAAANLRDLRDATGGFHRAAQTEEFESVLESLGQGLSETRWLEFDAPWGWRTRGGERKVVAKLSVDGRPLTVDAGRVSLPGKPGLLVGIGLLLLAPFAAAVAFFVVRGRASGGASPPSSRRRAEPVVHDDDDGFPEVLYAAHEMVAEGVRAQRAAAQLGARFADDLPKLLAADPESLPEEEFPVFQTRAGRNRLLEIKNALGGGERGGTQLGPELAGIIVELLKGTLDVPGAVSKVIARVNSKEWKAFARWKLDELAEALRHGAARYPDFGPPRARGIALALQDALRSRSAQTASVAWLVCAAGPMRRGMTIRLPEQANVIGSGTGQVRIDDSAVVPEHARIERTGDKFAITPVQGQVLVEGQPLSEARVLVDGEAITLGRGHYIFKQASG